MWDKTGKRITQVSDETGITVHILVVRREDLAMLAVLGGAAEKSKNNSSINI